VALNGRIVEGPNDLKNPGDYTLPMKGYTGELEASFFIKPNGAEGHVTFPPHEYIIEADGTLTISPSISDKRINSDYSDGWHGFLKNGIWSE